MEIISIIAKFGGTFFIWAGWTTILHQFTITNILAGSLALGFGLVPFIIKDKTQPNKERKR